MSTPDNAVTITVTEKMLNMFRDNNIFFQSRGGERLLSGDSLHVSTDTVIEPYTCFLVGNHLCSLGSFSYSRSDLGTGGGTVGRYCSIASGVVGMGPQHPMSRFTTSPITYDDEFVLARKPLSDKDNDSFKPGYAPVQSTSALQNAFNIEHDVWVGDDVLIKQGVTIHTGAVIAARAVLTKDVPPYAVMGGVPARIIKYRFPPEIIERLLELKWWEYSFADLQNFEADMPIEEFIERFKQEADSNNICKYEPKAVTYEDIIETL